MNVFNAENFFQHCDHLAKHDPALEEIIHVYGYPPLWSRPPGFTTLIHIILEQQVSLASALAAMEKLKSKIAITPANLLRLTDEEMKACYFSRQKMIYARDLATQVATGALDLEALATLSDDAVISSLKKVKGIGDWTADIYLMMALHRADRFPLGDIALVKSFAAVKPRDTRYTREEMEWITSNWKPYRTVAAYLLWHAYLSKRIKKEKAAK